MRILLIVGSPRANRGTGGTIEIPRADGAPIVVPADSCTDRLAAAFADGARAAGHEVVRFSLHDHPAIGPCRACYGCVKTGRCVLKDDMSLLYPEFDAADAVVFATPLYYATLPAQVLAIVNRLYPYWIDNIRYPKLKGAGVIGVCADSWQSWDLFDATWKSIFGEIGWTNLGILHAPDFESRRDEFLAAARQFGLALAPERKTIR